MGDYSAAESTETMGEWIIRVFGTYFFRLLGVNVLFLVCCIPIVTIPAALCGIHAVIQRYYRKMLSATVVQTFFQEFREAFWKRAILFWSVILIPGVLIMVSASLLSHTMWMLLSAFLLVCVLLVLSWFIPQLVFLNLPPEQALKNAFLLTIIENRSDFLLIILNVLTMGVMIFLQPLSGFFLVIIPALYVVLTTGIVMPVLTERLAQENSEN